MASYDNNQMPITIGGKYLLTPGVASSDWVIVTDIRGKWVYASGIDDNTASIRVPMWQFDDLVVEYEIDGVLYSQEDGVYELITDTGALIIF